MQVLNDDQWAELAPLIEQVRAKGKTPPHDLRRTIEAILWRHDNGAKWRALPSDLGPWHRAAQLFIRWARLDVWQRLLALVQERGISLGMVFMDGTSIRAHAKAAGAAKKGPMQEAEIALEALGRSRGGFGTKGCVIADGHGRAIAFDLAPGQAHELPLADGLLKTLPRAPKWVVADRGYSSHDLREHVWGMGARPAISCRANEEQVACPNWIYVNRDQVERLWGRLKEWRAIATRYEKTANSFMGVLCLKAALDWLKL